MDQLQIVVIDIAWEPPICTVSEEEPRAMVSRRTRFCARFTADPTLVPLFRPRILVRGRNLFLKAADFNSRTIQKTG